MRIFSRMQSAVRNLFHKQQVESELDEEVRAYVEMVTDERVAAGLSRAEARRRALAEAGGAEQVKQAVRESRAGNGLEMVWQDARYGLRQLRHNRAFTITAVLTLGLGIGATTTIFSAVYSMLLKPLPYPDANRLIYLSSHSSTGKGDIPGMIMSPDYMAAKASAKSFEQLAAYGYRITNLTGAGTPVRVTVGIVTANFLPLLGVVPQSGRLFTNADDKPDGSPVVMLGDRFWRDQFHGDGGVIGKTVDVNGSPKTIVGVMPKQFVFPSLALEPDMYTPEALDPDTTLSVEKPVSGVQVVGLLKEGVNTRQAQAEMQAFFLARVKHDYPAVSARAFAGRQMIVETLQQHISGDNRKPLYILLVCVGAVLLIACANVANLQLARAVSRQHETALRGALGASRLRLVRQFLVESLILSSLATAAGLVIAFTLTSLIRHASVPAGERAAHAHILELLRMPFGKLSATIEIDGWVLAFTVGLALLTTLLFGLAPAVSGSRVDLRNGLQSAALRMSSGREQRWVRHGLLIGEVAMAVVLLSSATLLVRSFVNVLRYDAGFTPADMLTGTTLLNDSTTPEQVNTFLAGLLPRLQALPGVEAAAVTSTLPLQGGDGIPVLPASGPVPPVGTWPQITKVSVTPDYFRTVGTGLARGRAFIAGDNANAPHVAIVNHLFEREFFAGDGLGKSFRTDLWGDTPYVFSPVTIVGVAEDVRYGALDQELKPAIFLPESQSADGEINIVVRTFPKVDPDSLANAMRKAVLAVDAKQPLFNIETMDQRISGAVAERRMIMLLISCFAMLAVILSAVGVYGVFAYSVSQRAHEMGIRLALGATRRGLLRLVMLQAARLIAVGGVLGMVVALMLSRLLASLLVGVTAHDGLSFALAWGLMTLVAMLASMLPAADAARTDLLSVLHSD